MDPEDLNILSQLAHNLLSVGNYTEALKCSETVLKEVSLFLSALSNDDDQDPKFLKGLLIKAEALYNMSCFEHALVLFTKVGLTRRGGSERSVQGQKISGEGEEAHEGGVKCRKTILNKELTIL